jgi:hypothetical protein
MNIYNTIMRQPLINNFDAVMERYILTLDDIYENSIYIHNIDRDLSMNFKLVFRWIRVLAWGVIRGEINAEEFMQLEEAMTRSEEVDETIYISKEDAKKEIEDLEDQIIDELLERNDWEFLKEREVTGE